MSSLSTCIFGTLGLSSLSIDSGDKSGLLEASLSTRILWTWAVSSLLTCIFGTSGLSSLISIVVINLVYWKLPYQLESYGHGLCRRY
nr:unnamed protein product [Callosobruchus analis]CAI5861934.1 unnamed protein product [Callosobruchus analis]